MMSRRTKMPFKAGVVLEVVGAITLLDLPSLQHSPEVVSRIVSTRIRHMLAYFTELFDNGLDTLELHVPHCGGRIRRAVRKLMVLLVDEHDEVMAEGN
jgi:hypothetical protein